ncbi:MAG: DNA-3-methyladenine glycosylase I [Bacteroidia bacterium]
MEKERCAWCLKDALYMRYHDEEWGVPLRDDRALFEKLILDGFQAGLSWYTILSKREGFLSAFEGFEPEVMALWGEDRIVALMQHPGIVRNQSKIRASVTNAQAYLRLQASEGSFSDFLWSFVDGQPIVNRPRTLQEVPATSPVSDAMSKELKRRGFKFVGSTICYAFMQAVGMVDDHVVGCWRSHSQ